VSAAAARDSPGPSDAVATRSTTSRRMPSGFGKMATIRERSSIGTGSSAATSWTRNTRSPGGSGVVTPGSTEAW
jgi:hypothetical protein